MRSRALSWKRRLNSRRLPIHVVTAENAPMILRLALISLIAIILFAGPIVAAETTTISGPARISDGDTITIKDKRVRLNGIDAPETDQICVNAAEKTYACGLAARAALVRLVRNRTISCTGNEIDRYDRRIMTCFVGEMDINAAMVAAGWALALSVPLALVAMVVTARAAKRLKAEFTGYMSEVEQLRKELELVKRHVGYQAHDII